MQEILQMNRADNSELSCLIQKKTVSSKFCSLFCSFTLGKLTIQLPTVAFLCIPSHGHHCYRLADILSGWRNRFGRFAFVYIATIGNSSIRFQTLAKIRACVFLGLNGRLSFDLQVISPQMDEREILKNANEW